MLTYSNSEFSNGRQTTLRLKLEPGKYVIIPCTYDQDMAGQFLLRILAEHPTIIEQVQ